MAPKFPINRDALNGNKDDKKEPVRPCEKIIPHERGPLRPPNQFNSLLLRVTRHCTWNRCLFCPFYKGQTFAKRPLPEIYADIDRIAKAVEEIYRLKEKLGLDPDATARAQKPGFSIGPQSLDNKKQPIGEGQQHRPLVSKKVASFLYRYDPYLASVAYWLYWGGNKVFLQDADALVMPPEDLANVLGYLQKKLPAVNTITAYTRGKTLYKRSQAQLNILKKAGLTTLHMGLETGCSPLLSYMQKGVTREEQCEGGERAVKAGLNLTMYVLLGLGGQHYSDCHARETAGVINQVNPTFTRLRTLSLRAGAPLTKKADTGEFVPLNDDETVQELRTFIRALSGSTYLLSDHPLNLLENLSGQLPEERERLLDTVDSYLNMPLERRLNFQLGKRWGMYKKLSDMENPQLYQPVEKQKQQLKKKGVSPQAEVERLKHNSML